MIQRLFTTPLGKIILSVVWGLGLAALFRQSCKGARCIIVQGPPLAEIEHKTFQYQGDPKCYRFAPVLAACPASDASSRPIRVR